MVDIQTEDDIERLRQVAVLQDAEIAKLHERISVIAAENEKLRQTKQGRLQRELKAVKDHLAKLEKMQFGASSEKRGRDEKRKSKSGAAKGVNAPGRRLSRRSKSRSSGSNSTSPSRSVPNAALRSKRWEIWPRKVR